MEAQRRDVNCPTLRNISGIKPSTINSFLLNNHLLFRTLVFTLSCLCCAGFAAQFGEISHFVT